MRRFVSGLALLLAFLAGTAALTSYVADQLLLDQSRAGELLGRALGQDDLRQELLTRAVPGYDRLPAVVRSRVDAAADSPATRKALESVQVGDDGSVSLSRLRSQVVRELRANGQSAIAGRLAAATGSAEVSVPSRYLDRLTEARDVSRQVWTVGGLVAGALAAGRARGLAAAAHGPLDRDHGAARLRRVGAAVPAAAVGGPLGQQRPAGRRAAPRCSGPSGPGSSAPCSRSSWWARR